VVKFDQVSGMVKNVDYIHPIQIGELLRKRRKELGLRLEDLADDFISPSTISNIERGITYVNEEKVRYIAEKLNVNLDRAHDLLAKEKQEEEQMVLKLTAIESMVDLMNPDKGLERLRKLDVPANHKLAGMIHYLRGKIYLKKKNWVKAKNYFLEAIRIMEQREDRSMTNIKAASYHELSRIAYENREWNQALSYIEEGISHFKEEGQRSHYKYLLQVSRIIYLNEANRLEEALRQIEKFWKEISCIESVDTVLELYMVRIKVLMKLKLHDEAIRYAIQGIELARINGKAGKACRLWQLMGKVYLLIKKWEEAEDCFLTVLSLQERLKNDLLKIRGQTHLGLSYLGQNRWSEAEEVLKEAALGCERSRQTEVSRETYMALGDCYLQQARYQEAILYYEKARELAGKEGDREEEHKIILKLAQCYERVDLNKFQEYVTELYKIEMAVEQEKELSVH
jgi:tetratricopeptide (TPR) repeat protein